jgi:signal transduction histidine kinase
MHRASHGSGGPPAGASTYVGSVPARTVAGRLDRQKVCRHRRWLCHYQHMVQTGNLGRTSVVAASLVMAFISVAVAMRDPDLSLAGPGWPMLVLEVGAGLLLVVAGAAAMARRSTSTAGVLLACAGGAWLVREWNSPVAGSAVVFTIGLAGASLCPAVAAHVAVIYPNLRPGRLGALVVSMGYLVCGFLLGLGPALFFDPTTQGCNQCPRNLLLVRAENAWVSWLTRVGLWAATLWACALVVLLAVRLLKASVARRRVLAPVALPVIGYVGLVAWSDGRLAGGGLGVEPLEAAFWSWQAVLLCLLAAGSAVTRVRARRTRASLTRLALDLGRSADQNDLRSTLAAVLDDPDLKVLYPLADGSRVNAAGLPDAPQPGQSLTELAHGGVPVAWLSHRPRLLDDHLVVEEITTAASLTIDYERLRAETQAQLVSLRASRARIVEASDAERQRLERNLHDGAQQRLVSLALALRLARITGGERSPADGIRLDACAVELASALEDLRDLAHGLYPSALADEGLSAAVELLAESGSLTLKIRRLPERRYPAAVESAAYFFVAEIVRRCAREKASVAVTDEAPGLVIEVEVDAAIDRELVDLEDRLGALDGRMTVSRTGNAATKVRAELPCAW